MAEQLSAKKDQRFRNHEGEEMYPDDDIPLSVVVVIVLIGIAMQIQFAWKTRRRFKDVLMSLLLPTGRH